MTGASFLQRVVADRPEDLHVDGRPAPQARAAHPGAQQDLPTDPVVLHQYQTPDHCITNFSYVPLGRPLGSRSWGVP